MCGATLGVRLFRKPPTCRLGFRNQGFTLSPGCIKKDQGFES